MRGVPRASLCADRGSAATEFAVAMPAVLLLLAVLLGGGQLAATQVRAQDAAADLARSWGRGDSAPAVLQGLPGARFGRAQRGDLVCASITVPATGALARFGIRARATSCALDGGR